MEGELLPVLLSGWAQRSVRQLRAQRLEPDVQAKLPRARAVWCAGIGLDLARRDQVRFTWCRSEGISLADGPQSSRRGHHSSLSALNRMTVLPLRGRHVRPVRPPRGLRLLRGGVVHGGEVRQLCGGSLTGRET